ncbi:MAG TPA: hypothetical protein VES39_06450 [Rhodospirillales bacterium]|nr:hypothetical protein [Rhodospirillales bacterium]
MPQKLFLLGAPAVGAAVVAIYIVHQRRIKDRARFIDKYRFPQRVWEKLSAQYPNLTETDVQQVEFALRDYFQICNGAGRRMISMPSQAVDVAWHEFILFTREYAQFCKRALGRFLHHTPAEAMSTQTQATMGIKRAWRLACARERISPRTPERLPRLFALDASLGIPDGFRYALNCVASAGAAQVFCASHIGCASGCGGEAGSSSDGDGGDGGCGGE